jgi:transposase
MPRYMLIEKLWSKLREVLLQFSLYNKAGLRKTVEGILFRMRTGVPWRDLPDPFGKWNSVYKVFNYWSKKGIWKKLFSGLTTDSDRSRATRDSTDRCTSSDIWWRTRLPDSSIIGPSPPDMTN